MKGNRGIHEGNKKGYDPWDGLGFPIRPVNVPMKKVFGEWVLDINLENFQKNVLHVLAKKTRTIKLYLTMSPQNLASAESNNTPLEIDIEQMAS